MVAQRGKVQFKRPGVVLFKRPGVIAFDSRCCICRPEPPVLCRCSDLNATLHGRLIWQGQLAFPPVVCTGTPIDFTLAEQMLPAPDPGCTGPIQRWWKGRLENQCSIPDAFDIEMVCCWRAPNTPDRQMNLRINDGTTPGQWYPFQNCDFSWCADLTPDLADGGDCDANGIPGDDCEFGSGLAIPYMQIANEASLLLPTRCVPPY